MEISVVMAAYNAEGYINETIDSVLRQSFPDFEFIIVDDGSQDNTKEIILSFVDSRIKLIENKHDFIDSVNKGISCSEGKYIAFMDNNDIMHIDRLKIAHAIMEEEPKITVCSSTMKIFGEGIRPKILKATTGIIENPLLKFIGGDFVANPTSMIRTEFVRKHNLRYEYYSFASDYKFWVEVAKAGGVFYIESQPLINYRISDGQASQKFQKEQREESVKICTEIIQYLTDKNSKDYPELQELMLVFEGLRQKQLMNHTEISEFYQNLFIKCNNRIKKK